MEMISEREAVQFYCFVTCPYAIRVRTALEHLQVPYDYKEVDLLTNQQLSPDFLKINPLHKVPVIITAKGKIISESLVCLEYINEKYNGKLLPINLAERANVRRWISYYSDIDSKKWKIMGAIRSKNFEQAHKILIEIQDNLKFLVDQIDLVLNIQKNPKSFLFGSTFGMADMYILPVLDQMIILFEAVFNKNILRENLSKNGQLQLNALATWFNNAKSQEAYQNSTYKLKSLPNNPLVDELKLRNNWEFDTYYKNFASRKFFNNQIPKL